MNALQDYFVATVAIAVGLLLVVAALANWEWYFTLSKCRWLVARVGRPAARLLMAALGLVVIALGIAIAQHWRWSSAAAIQAPHATDRMPTATTADSQPPWPTRVGTRWFGLWGS